MVTVGRKVTSSVLTKLNVDEISPCRYRHSVLKAPVELKIDKFILIHQICQLHQSFLLYDI